MRTFILRDTPPSVNFLPLPRYRTGPPIKGVDLEDGLHINYMTPLTGVPWLTKATDPDRTSLLSLYFLLTPSSIPHTIFITSNKVPFPARVQENGLAHSIEILFSREWLRQTGMDKEIRHLENLLVEKDFCLVPPGASSPADNQLLAEIESELHQPLVHLLKLRARVLLLFANTINRLPAIPPPDQTGKKNWLLPILQQVEQRLVQSLEDRLPSQPQLAREFALSESTLKRHFKAFYGKTLYEYYLGKKMERAKWLLQEKKATVSEAAYILGYENVSAFIITFKKYHKVLPGSLKPSSQTSQLCPIP